MKRVAFWLAIAAIGVLAAIGLAAYLPITGVALPHLSAGDERTIELEVVWGGDIYTSQESTCDVWTAQFNCELRRGGDMGTVFSTTLPLAGPIAQADPPDTGTVVTTTLTLDTSELDVGDYETWCRLELTNGTAEIWGYIEGQGQELDGYCLADKFSIGQTCIVPRRFMATVQ